MKKLNNIFIASDHAGYKLKQYLIEYISNNFDYQINNCGANSADESVDYPDYANVLAKKLKENKNSFGILICGSGIGMSIAANRHQTVRAALCHNQQYAKLAREHNNANVLVLGARFINNQQGIDIAKMFLQTEFLHGRHTNRVNKLL